MGLWLDLNGEFSHWKISETSGPKCTLSHDTNICQNLHASSRENIGLRNETGGSMFKGVPKITQFPSLYYDFASIIHREKSEYVIVIDSYN